MVAGVKGEHHLFQSNRRAQHLVHAAIQLPPNYAAISSSRKAGMYGAAVGFSPVRTEDGLVSDRPVCHSYPLRFFVDSR